MTLKVDDSIVAYKGIHCRLNLNSILFFKVGRLSEKGSNHIFLLLA